MIKLKAIGSELLKYPSAVFGVAVIAALVGIAAYALITIPYSEAIRLWRGSEDDWSDYPKNAAPVWSGWLKGRNLPQSVVLDSAEGEGDKTIEALSEQTTRITFDFPFDYTYDDFPREINVQLTSVFESKNPFVTMTWITPDGREIKIGDATPGAHDLYRLDQNERLVRDLGGLSPEVGLFAVPDAEEPTVLPGTYHMRIEALVFEPDADVEAKLIVYGQVHGLAGTDHRRRDLIIPILWGTPIALAFGLVAALSTSLLTLIIAAIGVWFGGWIDALIQRITEVNLVLPILPILAMVGYFYSRSIWTMLGLVILFSIFTGGIKSFRAIFLQVKESPYIEAARSYGASDMRIIFRYLIPRMVPLLIPGMVSAVPAFVFLEATLAVLGLGDPVLPTWGKMIQEATANGAVFNGYYYWILEPAFLLMLSGLGFAMLGFALDRVFNPRLREI